MNNLKEKKGFWMLIYEALDRTPWTARFGRGYGLVSKPTAEWWGKS